MEEITIFKGKKKVNDIHADKMIAFIFDSGSGLTEGIISNDLTIKEFILLIDRIQKSLDQVMAEKIQRGLFELIEEKADEVGIEEGQIKELYASYGEFLEENINRSDGQDITESILNEFLERGI